MPSSSRSHLIRVGLIGHGLAGCVLHAPLIEATGDYHITAVLSSRDLSGRRDTPRRAATLDDLLGDDVDLAVVVSPSGLHFEHALAALRAGKHVVVDKPFGVTAAQADALIGEAQARGLVLTAFHNRRWDGDFLAVAETIRSGALGDILLFEARWDRFRPEAPAAWRNRPEPGAGMIWDLGSHLVDQALLLFGPPDVLTADIIAQRPGAEADDYFELVLRYGPMRAILGSSSVMADPRPRFALHGTRGSLLTFGVDPQEAALRAGDAPDRPGWTDRLPPILARRTLEGASESLSLPGGDWLQFYRQLAAAVRGEGAAPVPASQARDAVAMIEGALANAGRASPSLPGEASFDSAVSPRLDRPKAR